MKFALFFASGVIVGAAVALPGMIFFLRSDAGLSLLRAYVAPQPEWPDVTVTSASNIVEVTNKLAVGNILIGVPKLYAGAEYSAAFNGALREVAMIATSSQKLVGLLTTINSKSLSRDYNGLFDLVASAKNIIAQQRSAVARFSQQLTALSAINQQTPDAQTKALTQDLYAKGVVFQASLEAYVSAVDGILSGSVPTAKQIADMNAAVTDAGLKGTEFSAAVTVLTSYFATAVKKTP